MAYNGIYGTSVNHYGAFFKGDRTAIEIGGSESEYTGGDDDAVIRTQKYQSGGDIDPGIERLCWNLFR